MTAIASPLVPWWWQRLWLRPRSPISEYRLHRRPDQPMPTGDLSGWTLIFNDDFNTDVALGSFPAAVSDKWNAYSSPWADSSGHGVHSPEIVSLHDSMMDIWVHTESGVHKVAAPVPKVPGTGSWDGSNITYGRYAVRFKFDTIVGYKTAWLLWPNSEVWPGEGELDFPEQQLDGSPIGYALHWRGGTVAGDQTVGSSSYSYSDWHVGVLEWTPSRVTVYIDGTKIGELTDPAKVPNTLMHWVLQTETATDGSTPDDGPSGHVYVDWVAVWNYAP